MFISKKNFEMLNKRIETQKENMKWKDELLGTYQISLEELKEKNRILKQKLDLRQVTNIETDEKRSAMPSNKYTSK